MTTQERMKLMQIPDVDAITAAFGADLSVYPDMDAIPEEHRRGRSDGCKVASALFFKGGKLSDHGLRLKSDVDSGQFYRALRSMLGSFAPPHELKEAACGWLIAEHTEPSSEEGKSQ